MYIFVCCFPVAKQRRLLCCVDGVNVSKHVTTYTSTYIVSSITEATNTQWLRGNKEKMQHFNAIQTNNWTSTNMGVRERKKER